MDNETEPTKDQSEWELYLCKNCNQMTNHLNGRCLKCGKLNYKKAKPHKNERSE